MKTKYNRKYKTHISVPETPLEAVRELWIFFQNDIWYAKEKEWKTEEEMLKYINGHFRICMDEIKKCAFKIRCFKCGKIIDKYPFSISKNKIICWECNDKMLGKININTLTAVDVKISKKLRWKK